jgi:hypothetical protein
MIKIDIDDEVWKELQKRAIPLEDTPNSVLRKLLELEVNRNPTIEKSELKISSISEPLPELISTIQAPPPNIIYLLEGKRLWKNYKGIDYYAEVKNGEFIINNKPSGEKTPSGAAMYVSGGIPINGWKNFWKYKDPNSNQWLPIVKLR